MGPWIMFTKHLEGWDLGQIIDGLQRGGVQGADLCVRPGYPVTPENAATELPAAAKRFADAGVKFVKLGYWYQEADGYWPTLDRCRKQLEGFSKIAEKTGVKPVVHNHSGSTMGCNSSAVMRLVEGFDPKLVGVFGDVGHLSVVGEPYPMAFSIVNDYLCALAFKDLVRKRNADGTWGIDVWPLGMGVGNFPQVMQLVKDMAFEGPISFHCEYSQMPPESIIHQLAIDTKFVGDIVAKLGL